MRLIDSPRTPDLPAIHLEIVADRFYPADYAWLRVIGITTTVTGTPEIAVRRSGDGHSLRQAGWSELPGGLPVLDIVVQDGVTDLLLGAEPFAQIPVGTPVEVSVPALDIQQSLTWPALFGAQDVAEAGPQAGAPAAASDEGDDAFRALPLFDNQPAEGGNGAERQTGVYALGEPDYAESPAARSDDTGEPARREIRPVRSRQHRRGGRRADGQPTPKRSWRSPAISRREDRLQAEAADRVQSADPATPEAPSRHRFLPWKITAVNVVLIALIAFTGYQMSTGGFNPFALFGSGDDVADATAPVSTEAGSYDAYQRAALDALATLPAATEAGGEAGPLPSLRAEADSLVRADAAAPDLHGAARAFLDAGRPDVALPLYELAYSRGSGDAALAIGRMSDPRQFTVETSGFTRPNAELAITWYRRAVEAGTVAAIIELDDLRLDLEAAAAAGNQDAANALLLFQ